MIMRPARTCLGCRRTRNKKDLIRIVRTPEGEIMTDPRQKAPGRGAYLCRKEECLARVIRSGALQRALKQSIPEDVWDQLRKEMS